MGLMRSASDKAVGLIWRGSESNSDIRSTNENPGIQVRVGVCIVFGFTRLVILVYYVSKNSSAFPDSPNTVFYSIIIIGSRQTLATGSIVQPLALHDLHPNQFQLIVLTADLLIQNACGMPGTTFT